MIWRGGVAAILAVLGSEAQRLCPKGSLVCSKLYPIHRLVFIPEGSSALEHA